ncbi:DUF1376 domain-containing protein [Paraburkholderia unamae]|uniref:Uncharacterized protein DUF1376 n=1 Tax=Paraburkholderia unamae TaxID=219649 RepID=A0ABX5KPC2_9BURK|nr:DUF1376 domain-containing protein [Paraburkholderia unamae]PVX84330.1 uncharacterized protein DUF1376 [Paraburkholderia unamae]
MDTLPNPLTPADCDLRDFPFMPLDVVRLRDSDLAIQVSGEEFRAAVLLWCAAWHQVPCGSLPDDDRTLSQLAGFGRVLTEWQKCRDGALRGWLKCSDGRIYHPVVAEKARDGWIAKLKQRFKTECARIKKHCQRHQVPYVEPDFDDWMAAGCPQGQPLSVPKTPPLCLEDKDKLSQGQGGGVPEDNPPMSPTGSGVVPREIDSKGQGEGQGQREGEVNTLGSNDGSGTASRAREIDGVLTAAGISVSLIGWERERGKAARGITASNQQVIDLAALSVSAEELRKAYDSAVADRDVTDDPTPVNAGFVRTFVEKHRRPERPKRESKLSLDAMTDAQREALCRELGISGARPGEYPDQFKARIRARQAELEGAAA